MEYGVFGECRNCKRTYLIRAEQGVAIPEKTTCPHCRVANRLHKLNHKLSGYHSMLKWDGTKLIERRGE